MDNKGKIIYKFCTECIEVFGSFKNNDEDCCEKCKEDKKRKKERIERKKQNI